MLRPGENNFIWDYETAFCSGSKKWANPEEAIEVGRQVGRILIDRYEGDPVRVIEAAVEVVDYKALPDVRRANIMHGVVDAIAEANGFGGDPEWVKPEEITEGADHE